MPTLSKSYDDVADSNALTITLASLPTDASLLAGRASAAVSNATNLYLDALVRGQIMTGTSPVANRRIEVWLYAALKVVASTPSHPDVLDGTDSAETLTSVEIKRSLIPVAFILTNGTSDVGYPVGPFSVASLCGGIMPLWWGVFVTHNTGVNLNATTGNHWLHYTGIKVASA